jgi:hypothetical protein
MTPSEYLVWLKEAAEDAESRGDYGYADLLRSRVAIEDRALGERYGLPLDEGAPAERMPLHFDSVDEWMRWRGR